MAANTLGSDINELLLGYYLNGGSWYDADAKAQFQKRQKQVPKAEFDAQDGRAEVMAQKVLEWAKQNGYSGKVKKVWWTARPGVLSKAVGYEVDSRKNPTDILIQFTDKKFLGVSAKSTKTKGDIGFKNPGIGTIESSLKINLKKAYLDEETKFIKKFKLSSSASTRKTEIRKNPLLVRRAEEIGSEVLSKIRDLLYKKLITLPPAALKKYVIGDWMDAEVIEPPYIKVTGMGNKAPFDAKVDNPLKNEKLVALQKYPIKLSKLGNESILVTAGSKKILKMRAKAESQKMASSIKFSGDPA